MMDEQLRTVVFCNGCFDLLHLGHMQTLAFARSLGDRLVVGLNTDYSVRQLKGPLRPIHDHHLRREMLEYLECVDEVRLFHERTAAPLLRAVRPDIYVTTAQYEGVDTPEQEVARDLHIPIVYAQRRSLLSTTVIINLIRERYRDHSSG